MGRKHSTKTDGWKIAVKLLKKYLVKPTKADVLLSDLPDSISSTDRRYCQFLFFGSIRHKGLMDYVIGALLHKEPRVGLRALLMVAIYEILEKGEEDFPKIVDYSVETAKELLSYGEAKLVNAVLRKVPGILDGIIQQEKPDSKEWLAIRYSHPGWLVDRWITGFGLEATRQLLEWNQETAKVYVRSVGNEALAGLEPAGRKGFYVVGAGQWSQVEKLIDEGRAYVQDPSTTVAPELADVKSSDLVLDLCAAPGGKSMAMGEALKGGEGQLVALDLPGERIGRLKANLARLEAVKYSIVEADLNNVTSEYLEAMGLPGCYDVVLLDAPCSNTGVLKRRVDAKWRLEKGEITKMAQLQLKLLKRASSLVKKGGRLVYSTCSIEGEENAGVIAEFLKSADENFEQLEGKVSYPWVEGCDGGGAFLLRRR